MMLIFVSECKGLLSKGTINYRKKFSAYNCSSKPSFLIIFVGYIFEKVCATR